MLLNGLREIKKDIIYYFPAQVVPALASFLAISIYTRFLSPNEYGIYILIINTIVIINNIIFGWLYNANLRYYELYRQKNLLNCFFSTNIIFFIFILLLIISILGILALILGHPVYGGIIIFLLSAKSCLNFIFSLLRAQRNVQRYAFYTSLNALGWLVLGTVLISVTQLRAKGVLLAMIFPPFLISIPESFYIFKNRSISLSSFRFPFLKKFFSYGMPLVGVSFGALVLSISDRYILQYLKGTAAVGVYAAGYDLVDKGIKTIFSILVAASYPVFIQIFEQKGEEEAKFTLRRVLNLSLLFISPLVVIVVVTSSQISGLFLGKTFHEADIIIPWVTAGTFLWGISQILAQWLQLKEQTRILLFFFIIATIVNVGLNFLLIPRLGGLGAAIATFISYFLYFFLCAIPSKGIIFHFGLLKSVVKIILSLFGIYLILITLPKFGNNLFDLCFAFLLGIVTYFIFLFLLQEEHFFHFLISFQNKFKNKV